MCFTFFMFALEHATFIYLLKMPLYHDRPVMEGFNMQLKISLCRKDLEAI
jgi:hypothetical protein